MIENGELTYTSQTISTSRRSSEISEQKQTTEKRVRSNSKSPPKYAPKDDISQVSKVTVNIVSKESTTVKRPKSPEKKTISPDGRKSPEKTSPRWEWDTLIHEPSSGINNNLHKTWIQCHLFAKPLTSIITIYFIFLLLLQDRIFG